MNQNQISPDDPRLTLYALDEMEQGERAQFEKLLEQDAAARQAVAEIRATVATVTAALEQEPAEAAPKPAGKMLRFPQLYFMISGLAAACFALIFAVWQSGHQDKQPMQLIEVPLAAAKEAGTLPAAPAPIPVVAMGRADEAPVPQEPAVALDKFAVAETRARVSADFAAQFGGKNEAERSAMATMQKARVAAPSPAMASTGAVKKTESDSNTAPYRARKDNDFLRVADQPLSTFPVNVGTASYANVQRFLAQKQRPPADVVHIEELVNYFPYHYAPPTDNVPFAASLEVAGAPWAPEHRLVRIGLKGREAGGTLVTIAKGVKIQVEFNPAQVAAYRLIGYENRRLATEDFHNDKMDAGEIGAGHTVTALYEVVPVGTPLPETGGKVDDLKYQKVAATGATATPPSKDRGEVTATPLNAEMLTVKVAYKEPTGDVSSTLEFPLTDAGARFEDASPDFKFAAAVAGFGMVLRDSPDKGRLTLAEISEWGRAGLDQDAGGYRAAFLTLVGEADSLLR